MQEKCAKLSIKYEAYLTNFSSSKVRQQAAKGKALEMKILVSMSKGVSLAHYSKIVA